MICTVFRPKRTKNGHAEIARLYRGRYRLEGDTKITDVPLHTTDKRVAQQKLEEIVRQKQLEGAGLLPPEAQRIAQQTPLLDHLRDYLADLAAMGRDPEYIYIVDKQIRKLFQECRWTSLPSVTPDSFLKWRSRQRGKAPKTLNDYLASLSGLLRWMERNERLEKNPLRLVQKVQTNGRQVRHRRAFTHKEMQRLLAIAGTRKVIYLAAVYTGLRRGELSKLLRTDLHLDASQPFMNVRASTTKNHKQATIAVHPDLLPELRDLLAKLPARESRVLADLLPTMDTFRADLKAAGIEFVDAQGRRADFHALRHTLATNLMLAGTSPRIAMEIMRHSDIKLTTKTYTDAGLLPVADNVINLPSFNKPSAPDSQIDSQRLFRASADLSGKVTDSTKEHYLELPSIEGDSRENSELVTTCPENEESCRARTRT
jgi:integrase